MSAGEIPPPSKPSADLAGLRRWARFLILGNLALVAIFVLLMIRQAM